MRVEKYNSAKELENALNLWADLVPNPEILVQGGLFYITNLPDLSEELYQTGELISVDESIASWIPNGVNFVSDGEGTSFIRPAINWDDVTISNNYLFTVYPKINSGDSTFRLHDGLDYILTAVPVESIQIIFTVNGEVRFSTDGENNIFDIDCILSLREILE